MIQIEKNVPISRVPRLGRNALYPWQDMKVGDSFFVPGYTTKTFGRTAAAGVRYGMTFSVRTQDGGVRVWRVA